MTATVLLRSLHLGVIGLAGCASFTGKEIVFAAPEAVSQSTPAPVTVWIEEPKVVSADPEFYNIVNEFKQTLRQKQLDFTTEKSIFRRIIPVQIEGSYRLSTLVKVASYRAPMMDGNFAVLAGALLPPFLGMLWAFPLSWGDCEGEIIWTFSSPDGKEIARQKQEISFWSGFVLDSQAFGRFLKAAANETYGRTPGEAATGGAVASANGMTQVSSPRVIVEGLADPPGVVVKKIAVMPLKPRGDANPKIVEVVDDLLLVALQTALGNQVELIGRADIDAFLGMEKAKYQAGCDDIECAVDIAGGLGADSIIAGTVGTLGAKYIMTLTWVSQKDARVINRHNEPLGTEVETFDVGTERAATALAGALAGP